MNILNLKINNFGKLENKEIKLKNGINIIYGKNESGKSTLLKFILGMFYGLSRNKNGKSISDYERYTPWNNGEFSGKIKYSLDNGKTYEVFREFKKKNPNIYDEDLKDISSDFNIDKTLGNRFFYEQTNVDEELFISTIASMQEEVKLQEKEQQILIQKMSNLASTGEDNTSFQKIMNKLNKKQMEEIGTLRSQDRPINIVKKRLEQIQNEKEKLSSYTNKQYEIVEKKDSLEAEIKLDEKRLELLKALGELQQSQELEKEKVKINENAVKEYKEKIQKLQNEKQNLSKNDTKEDKNNSLVKKYKLNNEKASIAFAILFLVASIFSIFLIKNDILTAISIVLFLVTIVFLGFTQYKKKVDFNIRKDKQNVENNNIINEIEILTNSTKKLEDEIKQVNNKLAEEYKTRKEALRNDYIGIIPIKTIDEILQKESVIYDINMLQNKISTDKLNLHSQNLDISNILPQIENLASLEEENIELEQEYDELIKKNDLINLAKEEIEKAYEIMKNNVTPKFTENLSEIIEKVSEGKYKNVKLDEEEGLIVETENGNYTKAENLSIGTIDQLYLSLRLGAGKEISKENLPIILDETFAYWDDLRLENIIKYINEEYSKRQIILFTCTNREKAIIEKLNYDYNYIEM